MFKTVKQPFFSADDGTGDGSQSGKTFTQEDVDRIVGERLSREKASKSDYDDLKEIADTLESFGYTGTLAEKKAAFKARADENRKAKELEELEEEAETTGTSPELLAEIKALKKDLAEIKSDKEQQKQQEQKNKKAEDDWKAQTTEFNKAHPDIDMDKLPTNEKFMKHLKNSNPALSFLEVYDAFVDLVGSAEKAAIEKINSNAERSTFSGKDKKDPSGGTHGLTERQQKLAAEAKMTNKEYADLYNQVKET